MGNGERQYEFLFRQYNVISLGYPGWTLSDVKDMTVREREHWINVIKHRQEMQQWQAMTQAAAAGRR